MLKIEFDPANKPLAMALGVALVQYGSGDVKMPDDTTTTSYTGDFKADAEVPAAGYGGKPTTACDDQHAPDPSADEPAPPAAAADTPVDKHGVPHNDKLCVGLKAKEPFYQSGANKGQWKRGKGVDEQAYNEWYAAAMPEDALDATEDDNEPVNTSAAFGGQPPESAETEQSNGAVAHKDAGELMKYISERQAAGTLTTAQVTEAYGKLNITINDLFSKDEQVKADTVNKLSTYLQQV